MSDILAMQDNALAITIAMLKVAPLYLAGAVVLGRLFCAVVAKALVR